MSNEGTTLFKADIFRVKLSGLIKRSGLSPSGYVVRVKRVAQIERHAFITKIQNEVTSPDNNACDSE